MSGHDEGGEAESTRRPRKSLLTKASVLQDGTEVATIRVRNLSETGIGGIVSAPLEMGASFTVRMRGIGDIPGHVAWLDGKSVGIEFDEPIATSKLEMANPSEVKLPGSDSPPTRFEPVTDYKRPGFTRR